MRLFSFGKNDQIIGVVDGGGTAVSALVVVVAVAVVVTSTVLSLLFPSFFQICCFSRWFGQNLVMNNVARNERSSFVTATQQCSQSKVIRGNNAV